MILFLEWLKKNKHGLSSKETNATSKLKTKNLRKKLQNKIFDAKKFLTLILIILLFIVNHTNYKRNKIIVSILSGRKKHLEILMIYLKYLLLHNKLSEIHLWQFINDINETEYIRSISNIHKTNGNFINYVNIYPEINNKCFSIKIKMNKNGACILINDKYEIIFNIDNTHIINVTLNINNYSYSKKQNIIYNENDFLKYIIKILDNRLIIKGKNSFEIKYSIDENNFNSIKIRSLSDSEVFWDYKEIKNKHIKLFDTVYRNGGCWYELYKYYLEYDYDILIKMDDDVVYLDIERFDEYITILLLKNKLNI